MTLLKNTPDTQRERPQGIAAAAIAIGDPAVLSLAVITDEAAEAASQFAGRRTSRTGGLLERTMPTPVDLSKEGVRDWFCFQSLTESGKLDHFAQSIHAKLLGGFIQTQLFNYWGNRSHFSFSDETDSLWEMSATITDSHLGSVARTNNPLRASRRYTNIKAVGFATSSDWGFAFAVRAGKTQRTLNLYFMFSSGDESITNALEITARLEDNPAVDQSLLISPTQVGKQFYKVPIVFRADSEGTLLRVMATVIQQTGDKGTQIGFQAATLA